jgi:hypothetical protein
MLPTLGRIIPLLRLDKRFIVDEDDEKTHLYSTKGKYEGVPTPIHSLCHPK